MGCEAADAAPNEAPISSVTLTRFYLSRHPITNAQYEMFDQSHARKRATGAGDHHPVVYVNNSEAVKFCQWLSARDRRRYRLPTEAEWEYAARGREGRKYPWGSEEGRGDLANFADRNTTFAWSDRDGGRRLCREFARRRVSARRKSVRDRGYGRKCLGMVQRFLRALSSQSEDESRAARKTARNAFTGEEAGSRVSTACAPAPAVPTH